MQKKFWGWLLIVSAPILVIVDWVGRIETAVKHMYLVVAITAIVVGLSLLFENKLKATFSKETHSKELLLDLLRDNEWLSVTIKELNAQGAIKSVAYYHTWMSINPKKSKEPEKDRHAIWRFRLEQYIKKLELFFIVRDEHKEKFDLFSLTKSIDKHAVSVKWCLECLARDRELLLAELKKY